MRLIQSLRKKLCKLVNAFEFWRVYILGRVLSISNVVTYLRNPNPVITIRLLKAFGATINSQTTFKRSVLIDNSFEDQSSVGNFSNLVIGSDCYIGDDVYFDLSNKIIIEDNVVVSGRVSFVTHSDCNRSEFLSSLFPRRCEPIKIGKGAWLGFNCTLLAGTIVGENTLIASNALLLSRAESYCLYSGIPASIQRSFLQTDMDQ